MNDVSSLSAIRQSPGCLFQGLGLDKVCLWRPQKLFSRDIVVSVSELDDEIRNRGAAILFRVIPQKRRVPLVLIDRYGVSYHMDVLVFDYTEGVFSFGVRSSECGHIWPLSVSEAWQRNFALSDVFCESAAAILL